MQGSIAQAENPGHVSRIHEAEQKVVHRRQKYEKLRDDVQTKMRILHDHKVKKKCIATYRYKIFPFWLILDQNYA